MFRFKKKMDLKTEKSNDNEERANPSCAIFLFLLHWSKMFREHLSDCNCFETASVGRLKIYYLEILIIS